MLVPAQHKFAPFLRVLESILLMGMLQLSCRLVDEACHSQLMLVGLAVLVIYLLAAEANGIYASWRGIAVRKELLRIFLVWGGACATLGLVLVLLGFEHMVPRRVLVVWMALSGGSLVLWRLAFRGALRFYRWMGRNKRQVAVAPADATGFAVGCTVENLKHSGMELVGWFDDRDPDKIRPLQVPPERLLGNLADMVEQARQGKIHRIYLAMPLSAEERIKDLIGELADTTASVYIVPDFFTYNLMHSRFVSLGSHTAIAVWELPYNETDWYVKRVFDLLFASVFLVFAGLPMLAIAAAVKWTSPGPALFRQRRYGISSQPIEVWKFRTMRVMEDGAEVRQATKEDDRITPIGKFLRRTSLDELPQFLNVLFGSMSVVGPRPHAISHNEEYRRKIQGYMLRHKAKPGITGWAQVNGWRGETDTLEKMEKRVEFDLAYIRNWSIGFDVKICWMTAWQLLTGRSPNAY